MNRTILRNIVAALSLIALCFADLSCGHTSAVRSSTRPAKAAAEPNADTRDARARRVPASPPEPPGNEHVADLMADHFVIVSWARAAVIAGFLEPIKAPLDALAKYPYSQIRDPSWSPRLVQLQAAARLTSTAATLDAAATGVATIGRICGECHVERDAAVAMKLADREPEAGEPKAVDSVAERMELHARANDLMWLGLTGPSDANWKAGAEALLHAPNGLDEELPAKFDEDLAEVRALAQQASDATSLADRADVYGLLLATCADCHTRWVEDARPAP
jgi:hypothetical protein